MRTGHGIAKLGELDCEVERLDNGLELILMPRRELPLVAVEVWYHVGSKDERPGRTGFAHLFEHMMFQGSRHWDREYFQPLQEAGARVNGSTNTDRTNYWQLLPSNFLERALWLEADRMGFLLDALTQDKLDNQRDVVRNERRQRYENSPYGVVWEQLAGALYPPEHPYSWPTIGSHADIAAATLEDVRDFFLSWYRPNNASLAVVGDFEPQQCLSWIERYFGGLAPGPDNPRLSRWRPSLDGARQLLLRDRVQLPRLYLSWHSPAFFDPGDAEADLLAHVLAAGKSSRLYRSLVHERGLAQDVSAFQSSRQLCSSFMVVATPRPGRSVDELRQVLHQELACLLETGPEPQELERAQTAAEASFVRRLQTVGGSNGLAHQLQLYNHYLGQPSGFRQDLMRYLEPDAQLLREQARRLLREPHLEIVVEPLPERRATTGLSDTERARMPSPQPEPGFELPLPSQTHLSNGLEVLLVDRPGLPLLTLQLVLGSGSASDPEDAPGLASFTAAMLDEGAAGLSALQISEGLAALGTSLSTAIDQDATYLGLQVLRDRLEPALEYLVAVLCSPEFPQQELERERESRLTRLLQQRDQPQGLAREAAMRLLYGTRHPYGHLELGSESLLRTASREQLLAHYRSHYGPRRATLIAVGDLRAEELLDSLERRLGAWAGAGTPTLTPAAPAAPERLRVHLIDRPGAAQSLISLVQPGSERSSPDYEALEVLNTLLGGMFCSRLNLKLREDKGYTYGVRSGFEYRRGCGPFFVQTAVQSEVTAAALDELLEELEQLLGGRPVSDQEVGFARDYLGRRLPQQFETNSAIAAELRELVRHGLPLSKLQQTPARLREVQPAAVQAAAARVLDPARAHVIVVGDAASLRPPLEALDRATPEPLEPLAGASQV